MEVNPTNMFKFTMEQKKSKIIGCFVIYTGQFLCVKNKQTPPPMFTTLQMPAVTIIILLRHQQ